MAVGHWVCLVICEMECEMGGDSGLTSFVIVIVIGYRLGATFFSQKWHPYFCLFRYNYNCLSVWLLDCLSILIAQDTQAFTHSSNQAMLPPLHPQNTSTMPSLCLHSAFAPKGGGKVEARGIQNGRKQTPTSPIRLSDFFCDRWPVKREHFKIKN